MCLLLALHLCSFAFRIRRHSKSVDVDTKVCGYCNAPFQLLYSSAKSQSAANRTPNQFALFVKENYASMKSTQPGMKHAELMSAISMRYRQFKSVKPIAFDLDDWHDTTRHPNQKQLWILCILYRQCQFNKVDRMPAYLNTLFQTTNCLSWVSFCWKLCEFTEFITVMSLVM